MNTTALVALAAGAYLLMQSRQAGAAGATGSGIVTGSLGAPGATGTGAAPAGGSPDLGGLLTGIASGLTNALKGVTAPLTPAGTNIVTPTSNVNTGTSQTVLHDAPVQQAASTTVSVEDLYHSILHRDPDAGGLAYWTQQLGPTIDTKDEYTAFYLAAVPELQAQQAGA